MTYFNEVRAKAVATFLRNHHKVRCHAAVGVSGWTILLTTARPYEKVLQTEEELEWFCAGLDHKQGLG